MTQQKKNALQKQRGVAVITALLLTTLAITIVASLFWQQQVQVRSIENQRLQLQKQWILRGALDWAKLILREDARSSRQDHLGEPWAVPLAPTPLSQYVDGSVEQDAVLSGKIVDAQSRFNLTSLSTARVINQHAVDAFARLLVLLQIDPSLAQACAEAVAASQLPVRQTSAAGLKMPVQQANDLLIVPGMNTAIVAQLKDYISILPRATPVNVNTAPMPVLAAMIDGLPTPAATSLLALRERRYFRDLNDLQQSLPSREDGASYQLSDGDLSFSSDFFLVYGKVKMGRALLSTQALLERIDGNVRVLSVREE
jgi:general secretion pathway protein K